MMSPEELKMFYNKVDIMDNIAKEARSIKEPIISVLSVLYCDRQLLYPPTLRGQLRLFHIYDKVWEVISTCDEEDGDNNRAFI